MIFLAESVISSPKGSAGCVGLAAGAFGAGGFGAGACANAPVVAARPSAAPTNADRNPPREAITISFAALPRQPACFGANRTVEPARRGRPARSLPRRDGPGLTQNMQSWSRFCEVRLAKVVV